MDMLARHEMVFGVGPAGTGKTYLAVAQGVALLQAGRVDRIVLSRPAVEAGERLGFLPGDMKEKVDPYLRPLYDALHDMMPAEQVTRRMAAGEIEVAPLAFMRGRTLAHCYAILDEAQNTTAGADEDVPHPHGRGHAHGDHRRPDPGGPAARPDAPACARRCASLDGVQGIAVARFAERDVVRHPLVARIVAAYGARWMPAPSGAGGRRAGAQTGEGWNREVDGPAPRRRDEDQPGWAGPAGGIGEADDHRHPGGAGLARRPVPRPEALARRAGAGRAARRPAPTGAVTVLLADDAAVKRLNGRHRAQGKPTNVLSFPGGAPGPPRRHRPGARRGAAGGARRPAAARPTTWRIWSRMARCTWPGHDHLQAGEARRMERAEARIMRRLGRAQPLEGRDVSGRRRAATATAMPAAPTTAQQLLLAPAGPAAPARGGERARPRRGAARRQAADDAAPTPASDGGHRARPARARAARATCCGCATRPPTT